MRIAVALLALSAGCGGCDETGATVDARDQDVSDAAPDAAVDARATTGLSEIHYLKASNAQSSDRFGDAIAISGDGNTIAISATGEASGATGVNGDQTSNTSGYAGAVYVFARSGGTWVQQAYVKASNANATYELGTSVALSFDGNTLAVGSYGERSGSTGIDGSQADDNVPQAGAAYVFTRSSGMWTQQAYIKASNAEAYDTFGVTIALSADGNTLAVGASWESSSAVGINGDQLNNSTGLSGAVYVFARAGTIWSQQAYVKASNTGAGDYFGAAVALADDGNTMAVGAFGEASGIPDDQTDDSSAQAGAVYVFRRSGTTWTQQAYLKAPYPTAEDFFGRSVSLSADGSTLAVSAELEDSAARGIDGNSMDETAPNSGAAFIFRWSGSTWSAPVYIKAGSSDPGDLFGSDVELTAAGDQLLVGARGEAGASTGFGGDPASNAATNAGAAYLFTSSQGTWSETYYLKASNAAIDDGFGIRSTISADGAALVISAVAEASSATGVDGNQMLDDAPFSGAAYVIE